MPHFKTFIFPLRKIVSLPSPSLGTLYVYVFSSVLHVICVAKMSSTSADNDSGKDTRPMKHGKG